MKREHPFFSPIVKRGKEEEKGGLGFKRESLKECDMLSESTKRETQWYVINIKARDNQIPQHYVDMFNKLQKEDPLVSLMGDTVASIRDVTSSENVDDDGITQYMRIRFLVYTIIDKDAFYNIKEDKTISMDWWNKDIVANKKETALIFIPKFHKLAFRKSDKISVKQVQDYLSEALNKIEENGFIVNIVTEQDKIQRILEADSLISLSAKISFDNGTHTNDFREVFEDKTKQSNAKYVEINLKGSKEQPINKGTDSLAEAILKASEMNGEIVARIKETPSSKEETIDTKNHPKILKLPASLQVCNELYKRIKKLMDCKL